MFLKSLNRSYQGAIVGSLLFHLVGVATLGSSERKKEKIDSFQKVKVMVQAKPTVVEKKPPEPEPIPPKPEPKKETPPKPKTVKKAPALKQQQSDSPKKTVQPVLGLSKDSFDPSQKGPGPAVPVGNTTMTADEGKRLRPEEIEKLDVDLSADAQLILDSFVKPKYTIDAEDAGLEGLFVIDVFVDAGGEVREAELRRKIGFGMDSRLLDSIKQARFSPRKNALGQPISGWTEVKIRLNLE